MSSIYNKLNTETRAQGIPQWLKECSKDDLYEIGKKMRAQEVDPKSALPSSHSTDAYGTLSEEEFETVIDAMAKSHCIQGKAGQTSEEYQSLKRSYLSATPATSLQKGAASSVREGLAMRSAKFDALYQNAWEKTQAASTGKLNQTV